MITNDFITKLPKTTRQHYSIMIAMDRLTKVAHFITVKSTHKVANIEEIYMKEIARLHGIPKVIVSDRDSKLNSVQHIIHEPMPG